MLTNLVYVVIVIAIAGVIVWAIQTYVPMPPWAKGLITVVCVIFCLLFLLSMFGGAHAPGIFR